MAKNKIPNQQTGNDIHVLPSFPKKIKRPGSFIFQTICLFFYSGHLEFAYFKKKKLKLVGGFNPFEKYESKWKPSPGRDENKKYLKPPPSKPTEQ